MKTTKLYLLIVFATMMLGMPSNMTAQDNGIRIWVSPQGSDTYDGSKEQPFASLEKALSHARQLRAAAEEIPGELHIILRGGTYRLSTTLTLTEEDSGTASSPTIIEAAEDERPVLSVGIQIRQWQDAGNVTGLPATAQGHVWEAVIPDGTARFRQLWVDGQKMKRSSTLDDLSLPRLIAVDKPNGKLTVPLIEQSFNHPEQLEMTIIQDWTTNTLRVKTLQNDGQRSRLTFKSPESEIEFKRPWPILRADEASFSNHMFYLSNAIELLDRP